MSRKKLQEIERNPPNQIKNTEDEKQNKTQELFSRNKKKSLRKVKRFINNIVDNSNIPDTEYLWREYKDKPTQVACRLVRGEVCAKVSYTFNGASEFDK